MLLPREHLPLSAIDLSQPFGDLPASRLFESQIKILELEGRLGSNVLLARSETARVIYAIERQGNGLYVVCKLGHWVDMGRLAESATVVCSERMRSCKPIKVENNTISALISPQMHKEAKRRKSTIEEIQSLVRRRSIVDKESQSRPSTPITNPAVSDGLVGQAPEPVGGQPPDSVGASTKQEIPVQSALPMDESQVQPTADDIFQNIRTQYFEALYHSMVCNFYDVTCPCADLYRDPWHISQKAHCRGPALPSTLILTLILRWAIS